MRQRGRSPAVLSQPRTSVIIVIITMTLTMDHISLPVPAITV